MSCVAVSPISQLSAGPVAFPMVSRPVMVGNPAIIAARHRLNTPALALASAQGRKRLRDSSTTSTTFSSSPSSTTRLPLTGVSLALVADPAVATTATTTTTTTTTNVVTPRSAMASTSKSTRREKRSVRFASEVEYTFTHSSDEYDRSAQPMAKLSFRDFAEMLQVRATLRRQMEEAARDAANGRVAKGNIPAMLSMQAMHT